MTSKREQIEAMLQKQPKPADEVFLRYSLAMNHLSDDGSEPDETAALEELSKVRAIDGGYVPVYLQLGMLHSRLDQSAEAREALEAGIPVAQSAGDAHAVSEMQAVLDSLPE